MNPEIHISHGWTTARAGCDVFSGGRGPGGPLEAIIESPLRNSPAVLAVASWLCRAYLAYPTLPRRRNGCLFASMDWAYKRALYFQLLSLAVAIANSCQLAVGSAWPFLPAPLSPREEWALLCQWGLDLHEGSLPLQLPSLAVASWLLSAPLSPQGGGGRRHASLPVRTGLT